MIPRLPKEKPCNSKRPTVAYSSYKPLGVKSEPLYGYQENEEK